MININGILICLVNPSKLTGVKLTTASFQMNIDLKVIEGMTSAIKSCFSEKQKYIFTKRAEFSNLSYSQTSPNLFLEYFEQKELYKDYFHFSKRRDSITFDICAKNIEIEMKRFVS